MFLKPSAVSLMSIQPFLDSSRTVCDAQTPFSNLVLQELPGEFSLGLFEGREGRSF